MSELQPTGFAAVANLVRRLDLEASSPADTGRDAQLAIMESILTAESVEEIFAAEDAGTISSTDFTNRPFNLRASNMTVRRSATNYVEAGASPFYYLLRVHALDDGQDYVLNVGGYSAVAVLAKLEEIGALDDERGGMDLVFIEKPVSSGYSVILVKPVTVAAQKSKR